MIGKEMIVGAPQGISKHKFQFMYFTIFIFIYAEKDEMLICKLLFSNNKHI